jgi:putative glutamine transport system substrate-binding protein
MKKILSLFFIIISIFLFSGCKKKEVETAYDKIIKRDLLIVGVKTDTKPFGFVSKNTNEIVGYDVDIAKNIALDILGSDRKIKFVSVNPNTRIEAITSGEVDIVCATMSINKQRQYLIDFSKPYYIAGQTALVKEDSDIHTFSDLKKKRTIVVLGTTAEKNIRRIIPTAHLIGYKSYKEAFAAFLEGYGDAIITDDTILSGFMIDHSGYRLLKNRITKE